MWQKLTSLFLCYLLLFTCCGVGVAEDKREDRSKDSSGFWEAIPYVVAGGGLMALGLPLMGFTGAGIAANSLAASLMSWSAVANGGGVPAGGLVATLQSLGATGGSSLMAKVGAFLGYGVYQTQKSGKNKDEE
ncbi:PREDICTED: interferon alpha-inducible protein 6 [Elephantulus edwardii]|uniref:interferon alpha-inducible protein 6 n=1 Tax=Elephantulus edwardii TaxID=28737 RepID=UPI0003F0C072|nr:PREDICTED: interferon alpha-inducible protein 6 [Elephantulus edwardii]